MNIKYSTLKLAMENINSKLVTGKMTSDDYNENIFSMHLDTEKQVWNTILHEIIMLEHRADIKNVQTRWNELKEKIEKESNR